MATLDEIRLQQLLQPFENQNTGITNTTAASPFINTADILNQYNVPNLTNQNLVDEIIKQNMQKNVGSFINVPQNYYPSNTGGITEVAPLQNLGIDTSYGVANEPDDTQSQEYIDQVKKSQGSGIGGLLKFLVGLAVPGAGFLMNLPRRGLEGIRSLNQRLRSTDFGQSRTLQEYFEKRAERKAIERARQAAPDVYRDAADRGTLGPGGGFSTTGTPRGETMGDFSGSTRTSRGRQDY